MPTQTVPGFETIMRSKTAQAGCLQSLTSSGADKHQQKLTQINNLNIIVEGALKEVREFYNQGHNQAWESTKVS